MTPKRPRVAEWERKSKETEIQASLNLDAEGEPRIALETPLGLINHMLELFAFHGFFDLTLRVQKADTHVDVHHTNEDIGIVLGKTFKKALGEKEGIRRFGAGFAVMEDTLGRSVVDISGRGYLHFQVHGHTPGEGEDGYSLGALEHFLESWAHQMGATVHVDVTNPSASADLHTVMETVFKSLGLALDEATGIDPRRQGHVPSTKGIID